MKYFTFCLLTIASATLCSAGGMPMPMPNASSAGNVSASCLKGIDDFLSTPDVNSCFPYNQFKNESNSSTSENATSILNSICTLPKCNDSLIDSFVKAVNTCCSAEVAANDTGIVYFIDLIKLYSPIRDTTCFKDSTGQYCVIDDYNTGEKYGVNLTDPSSVKNIPQSALCTTCNKAIVNTFSNFEKKNPGTLDPFINNTMQTEITVYLSGQCGSSFVDGNIPNTTTSTEYSTAGTSSSSFGPRPSFLMLIGTILALLAFY